MEYTGETVPGWMRTSRLCGMRPWMKRVSVNRKEGRLCSSRVTTSFRGMRPKLQHRCTELLSTQPLVRRPAILSLLTLVECLRIARPATPSPQCQTFRTSPIFSSNASLCIRIMSSTDRIALSTNPLLWLSPTAPCSSTVGKSPPQSGGLTNHSS